MERLHLLNYISSRAGHPMLSRRATSAFKTVWVSVFEHLCMSQCLSLTVLQVCTIKCLRSANVCKVSSSYVYIVMRLSL